MSELSYINELSNSLWNVIQSGLSGWKIILDPHQRAGYEAVRGILVPTAARSHNLIMACGSWKTWMEVGLLVASWESKWKLQIDQPDLLIYTEQAIKTGILDTIEEQGIDFWIWEGGKKPNDRSVIVASVQVLQRSQERLWKLLPLDMPLIVWDEADLLVTEKRIDLLRGFRGIKFGFSATDVWPDGRSICDAWGETIYRYDLAQAIADGIVLRPQYQLIQSSVSLDALPRSSGDYPIEILDKVLIEAEVYSGIVSAYDSVVGREKMKTHPTIVAVPSVNLVRRTSQAFREKYGRDISIRWWTWEDSTSKTVGMDIEEYKWWEVDVLIVCQMGWRGMNLPNARVMIDASCTASLTKISQLHPRVMRRDRNNPWLKPDCIIIQIVPTTKKWKPKTFYDVIEYAISTRTWRDFEAWEIKSDDYVEPLPPKVLEGLRQGLNVKWNHTMQLVGALKMGDGSTYTLNEDGTVTLEGGVIFAPIEYFMKLFGISTASIVRQRIQNYSGNDTQEWEEGTKILNIDIDWKTTMKVVYAVAPIEAAFRKERGSMLFADEDGCYTDPQWRKCYSKTRLKQMTRTRQELDFTWGLTPIIVRQLNTNRQLQVYAMDDYVMAINTRAVQPNAAGAYVYDGKYQDLPSLEKDFPEITEIYTERSFPYVSKHKPWNPKIWYIQYIYLVSIEAVRQKYSYIKSLPEIREDGRVIWGDKNYLSASASRAAYWEEPHILERSLWRNADKTSARTGWREVTVYLESDLDLAYQKRSARQTNLRDADSGICIIDERRYYTTNYISQRYGFSNSQAIDVLRAHNISSVQLDGVKVYLFPADDVERVFWSTDLCPNAQGELTSTDGIYVDENFLNNHFPRHIVTATIALASQKWIKTKIGYYVLRWGKQQGTFYEKESLIKLAQSLIALLENSK